MCEGIGASRLVFGRTTLIVIYGAVNLSEMFADAFFARDCSAFFGGYDLGSKFFTSGSQLLQPRPQGALLRKFGGALVGGVANAFDGVH